MKSRIDELRAIMAKTGLSSREIAAGAGISPTTMRIVLLSDEYPQREKACRALDRFIAANRTARQRDEVRFAALH